MSTQRRDLEERRTLNSEEIYWALKDVDVTVSELWGRVRRQNNRLYGKLQRMGELWVFGATHSGVIVPVQNATRESVHEAWVDWLDETHEVLEQRLDAAP